MLARLALAVAPHKLVSPGSLKDLTIRLVLFTNKCMCKPSLILVYFTCFSIKISTGVLYNNCNQDSRNSPMSRTRTKCVGYYMASQLGAVSSKFT